MGIGLGPHIKRYKDIAMLLVKYGNSDLVKSAGLDEYVDRSKNGKGTDDSSSESEEKVSVCGAGGKVIEGKTLKGPKTEETEKAPGAPKDESTKSTADELTNDIEKLGPAFVKLGQLLSTRSDLMPPQYLEALSRLQDKCEPVPFADIEKRVVTELGVRISKAFLEFDSEPIAAASLGQIHKATLRDGRVVAVKVQRPGIREGILEDLEILREIADFYDKHTQSGKKYEFSVMLDEFRKSVLAELDYQKEAQNLDTLRKNLEEFDSIVVPEPVHGYSTSTVLTMDFVKGKKVTDVTRLALLELDGAPLAEDVFRCYLKQILVDGFFHADPHPGNVLLTEDKKVALIDLGMVARLSPHLQGKLLQMVVAISEGRPEAVANVSIDIGEPKEDFDETLFRRRIADLVQNDLDNSIEGMQVGKVVLMVTKNAGDCGIRVPAELTMVGKALMNLDQVGRTLYPDFDVNASVRRNASHILQQRMLNDLKPGNLGNNFLEAQDLIEKLPRHVNMILDLVAHNKLSMRVIDEPVLIESFQKVANRISLALILASLVVGAALLARVPTPFTFYGYPVIAIICFVGAAVGAFAMAVQIAFYDQKAKRTKENAPPRAASSS